MKKGLKFASVVELTKLKFTYSTKIDKTGPGFDDRLGHPADLGNISECKMKFTQSHDVITSPGYPQNYRNNIDCTWLIQLSFGQFIEATFLDFDVEYSYVL